MAKDDDKQKQKQEAEKREREAQDAAERAERDAREQEQAEEAARLEREADEARERDDASKAQTLQDEARAAREREQGMRQQSGRRRLSVREAANEIRTDLAQPPPEARHLGGFAERVCGELGMDTNTMNVARVIASLDKHGIDPGIAEYPKWVGGDPKTGAGGTLVHNADEEAHVSGLDGDEADEYRMRKNSELMAGPVSAAGGSINPLRDRPPYEPGALPGEPGGQDGPEASPVRIGGKSTAPPQTIEQVHNEPSKRKDIDTAHGLNAAARERTDSPARPADEANPQQPFPKVQQEQQNRADRLEDHANG